MARSSEGRDPRAAGGRRDRGRPDGSARSPAAHRLNEGVGGKDNIPSGVAAHDLGEHFLNAFVGSVADVDAGFLLELSNGIGSDVIGPVVYVQARPAGAAGGRGGGADQQCPAVHVLLNLSDRRTIRPNNTTTMVETAFSIGFTPRRARA